MGRFSGIANALNIVAAKLKQEQEGRAELKLLGQTEAIKAKYAPKEWKPQTKEEAFEFERGKAGLKAKPNDWDLWKQAENEVKTSLGGSTWMALDEEKAALYYPQILTRFNQLQKQFGKKPTGEPIETPTQKSPYPEYPDAFQENGVWKVMKNGKKYRIEE